MAGALPVCIYRLRDRLRAERLHALARGSDDKHALGFFLDLTGTLSNEPRFRQWTKGLRDRRRRAQREFFFAASRSREQHSVSRALAPKLRRSGEMTRVCSAEVDRLGGDEKSRGSEAGRKLKEASEIS